MKAKFIFILFSKVLLDVSFAANAQQTNGSLSAMKDSFPAFATTSEDGIVANTDYGFPNLCPDTNSNSCPPSDAFVVISKMTEQVRSGIETKRVRVVSSDDQAAQTKKHNSKGARKEKGQN